MYFLSHFFSMFSNTTIHHFFIFFEDLIANEYLKHSFEIMSDIYVKLFNLIFDKGLIPEQWLYGDIILYLLSRTKVTSLTRKTIDQLQS
jgi:hypothetical protein